MKTAEDEYLCVMDKTELTWADYFICGRTVSLRNIVLLEPSGLIRPQTNPETHREMETYMCPCPHCEGL